MITCILYVGRCRKNIMDLNPNLNGECLIRMENANVSRKSLDATGPKPATWRTWLAASAANRHSPVCRRNAHHVPDRQSQSVPDRHPGRKLSGTDSLCSVPI